MLLICILLIQIFISDKENNQRNNRFEGKRVLDARKAADGPREERNNQRNRDGGEVRRDGDDGGQMRGGGRGRGRGGPGRGAPRGGGGPGGKLKRRVKYFSVKPLNIFLPKAPEVAAANVSLTVSPETPGPASRPRRRGAAAARGTGATSRMTSRWVSARTCSLSL